MMVVITITNKRNNRIDDAIRHESTDNKHIMIMISIIVTISIMVTIKITIKNIIIISEFLVKSSTLRSRKPARNRLLKSV